MTAPKNCKTCGESDISKLVTESQKGYKYIRNLCKSCKRIQVSACVNRLRSKRRKDKSLYPKHLFETYKNSDQKKGWINDLTLEFIAKTIEHGCSYCEEQEIKMTLDRIDNSRGHTQDNVVSACIRCNTVRKRMPHKAWLIVAKRMKSARKKGLFGDWAGDY